MSKFFGFQPKAETIQLIEKFENEVLHRHNNEYLVGTVYIDIQENRWAVAFAYNYSRNQGLMGHENRLEVRYSFQPDSPGSMKIFRSDPAAESVTEAGYLPNQDLFVQQVLNCERTIISGIL